MKALSSLPKYLGMYDKWEEIVKRFQLKWADSNKTIQVVKEIFGENNDENSPFDRSLV